MRWKCNSTKAKCDTCFRHLNASVKTKGGFTVTHFRNVSITKNSLAVILTLPLSIEIASLLLHVLLKNTMKQECIGCCSRDTDKQLGLKLHRPPKEETCRKFFENFWTANNHYFCRDHFLSLSSKHLIYQLYACNLSFSKESIKVCY